MKKVFAYLSIMFFLLAFVQQGAFAQKAASAESATETVAASATEESQTESAVAAEAQTELLPKVNHSTKCLKQNTLKVV